jgi:mannose/fructose/N-acetylgalactosamine-specific phosphotransferase system component IID
MLCYVILYYIILYYIILYYIYNNINKSYRNGMQWIDQSQKTDMWQTLLKASVDIIASFKSG